MRISDWSSDVCSSDLEIGRDGEREIARHRLQRGGCVGRAHEARRALARNRIEIQLDRGYRPVEIERLERRGMHHPERGKHRLGAEPQRRSEEHTSELQSLMRISYAVFCLKKKNKHMKSFNNSMSQQDIYKCVHKQHSQ